MIRLVRLWTAPFVDFPGLKPYCEVDRSLWFSRNFINCLFIIRSSILERTGKIAIGL